MPPFEYKPFVNPYIGSISELMGKGDEAKAQALLRIGEIQAREAEQRGQAWGNAIQGIGNIASKTRADAEGKGTRVSRQPTEEIVGRTRANRRCEYVVERDARR
jgi:hypothetical protein